MNFTFDDLKSLRSEGYTDEQMASVLFENDKELGDVFKEGYTLDQIISVTSNRQIPEEPEPEPSGLLRQAADIPLKFAQGGISSAKSFTDLFGADNAVSKELAGYEKWVGSLVSAESKKDDEEIARILKDAQDKGVYDKVIAGLQAFAKAPLEMSAQTVGYMVPLLAAGVLGKAAQFTKAGIIGTQAALGFAQGVGQAKGDIYQSTLEHLREQGVPEDKANSIAVEAQSTLGKNLDQILLSGGLLAVDSTTGAEAIITRVLTKQGKQATGGAIKGLLKGVAAESPIEAVQSAQQEVAKNVALQREGFDVPTFKSAIESATTGAVAGAFIGGPLGAFQAMSPEQKAEVEINKEANRKARDLEALDIASQAIAAGITNLERGIDNKRKDLDLLESTSPEASKLRLDISADQKLLAQAKEQANKLGLSETITEAERQQIELAKAITQPESKPLPTDVLPTETAGATYGREEQIYDVFGGITRKPVSIPKPAKLPTMPSIEEQKAGVTYGGETGVFDVFAGARRKPVVTEEPPVSMVGKEVIPGVTPEPVVIAQPKATKEAIASATNVANQIEEENKVLEKLTQFNPPSAPTLQDARSLPDAVAKKGQTLSISGGKQEKNILDPKKSKKRFDEIGYEREALELPEDMNDRVSRKYGNAIANIKSLFSSEWLGAHFHGGIAISPYVEGTQRGRILAHELGHASHSLLGDQINKDQNVLNELQAIEELLYPGLRAKVSTASNPDASFFNYLLSPNELIAEFNVERISNPERAAKVAPALSALLESSEKMKGLVADRKTFPTIMGSIIESKERLKVKDLKSRKIKDKNKDFLSKQTKTVNFILERGKKSDLENAKLGLRNLKNINKAPKSYSKRTAELTGNQELIDYVEEIYTTPSEPTIKETLTVVPETTTPVTETPAITPTDWESKELKDTAIEQGLDLFAEKSYPIEAKAGVTPKMDTDYLAAVESGDMDAVQRMVDTVIILSLVQKGDFVGYGIRKDAGFLKIGDNVKNSFVWEDGMQTDEELGGSSSVGLDPFTVNSEKVQQAIKRAEGYRGNMVLIAGNDFQGGEDIGEYIIADAEVIYDFSADPVTYDEAGNVIPLSQRFDVTSAPATAEPAGKPKLGEKGSILIPSREDFIQAGQNLYEAGMEFGTWAKQMIQEFGDVVREFLGDVWQAVSGAPAKFNEVMGYLPKKGEAGALSFDIFGKLKRYTDKGTIVRLAIKQEKDTPKGILSETIKIIKQRVFDGDSIPSESTTRKAWGLIERLEVKNKESSETAEAINQLTRETMQEVSIAEDLTEVERQAFEAIKQTVGAVKLNNELYKYAIKLAGQGDDSMLKYLLNNELNIVGTSVRSAGDVGRTLGALAGIKSYIIQANEAEQAGFIQLAAQRFFSTTKPTEDQIAKIKRILFAVNETKVNEEEVILEELTEVGGKIGTELVENINAQIDKASKPEVKDPMVAAIVVMLKLGGTFVYKKTKNKIKAAVEKTIKGGLTGYRDKLVEGSASGLESGFWKTLSSQENKPGPLGELDSAQNRELGNIVKSTLISLGLQGKLPNTKMSINEPKMSINEQVASILGEKPLSQDKVKLADEKIRSEINRKREKELSETEDSDVQDAINFKYDQIEFAWDESMSRNLDMPVSDTMLRRLIFNELKEGKTSVDELATLMNEEPTIGISRQDRIVGSIINKIAGVTFEGQNPADYTLLKEYLSNQLESLVQEKQTKKKAVKTKERTKANQAQTELDKLANIQSDTPNFPTSKKIANPVKDAVRNALKLVLNPMFDPKASMEFMRNWKKSFAAELQQLGVDETTALTLTDVVGRQIELDSLSKNLDSIDKAIKTKERTKANQAQTELDKLARIQSDTPDFPTSEKIANPVKDAVRNALKLVLNPMFDPKASMEIMRNWKKSFAAELQQLGVGETTALTLTDVVGRQIEMDSVSKNLDSIDKAINKGALSGVINAIKTTPLADQQKPNWRYEVMRDYLRNAGLPMAQAEKIAKLMDISLQKRFAKAQEEAATSIAKTILGGINPESNRGFVALMQAIRAQVLNPGSNVAKEFGQLLGWKGFTTEQLKALNEFDSKVNDETITDAERAVALEGIKKIIDRVALPQKVRDSISAFYIGQALGRFTVATVQVIDPIIFSMWDAAVASARNVTSPSQVMQIWGNFGSSFINAAKEATFSFRNDIMRSGRFVDYLETADRKLKRLNIDANNLWKSGKYIQAIKKYLFGYPEITSRVLKALDDAAFSFTQQNSLNLYMISAMNMAKIPKKDQLGALRMIAQARQMDIADMIAKGISKNDATIYANERMKAEISRVMSGLNLNSAEIIDSAINESLSRIGKTRFKEQLSGETELKDEGTLSYPFLKIYELTSQAISGVKGTRGEAMRIFQRMFFGFPLIVARVANVAYGYTPLTIYRHLATGRYPLTYGTALQRRKRWVEQLSGFAVLAPLFFLRSMSFDDDDEPIKIVFTGFGPVRSKDAEAYNQWNKKHNPGALEIFIGGKRYALDSKSAGPLKPMIEILGAIDDWEIRKFQEGAKITKKEMKQAQENAGLLGTLGQIAGSFALTAARRGPATGLMDGLINFRRYPDDPIAAIAQEASFSLTPFIPVIGFGATKNISDFLSEPIDTRTKEGALLNNIPIIGPMFGKPAINAFGQPIGDVQISEKIKKSIGIPITLVSVSSGDDAKLAKITLKNANGPEPLQRNWFDKKFETPLSDQEWRTVVEDYAKSNRKIVLENYEGLNGYDSEIYKIAISNVGTQSKYTALRNLYKSRKKP